MKKDKQAANPSRSGDTLTLTRVKAPHKSQWFKIKKYKAILWFMIPSLFLVILFGYVPMGGILFAFKDNATFNLNRYPPDRRLPPCRLDLRQL